jgi:glutamyl endopeptidase
MPGVQRAGVTENIDYIPPSAGILSYGTPETVCGNDDRIKVSDTLAVPYQWVVRLEIIFNGNRYRGSGFVLSAGQAQDRLVVATSGHCVFARETLAFASSIKVMPQANGSVMPLTPVTVTTANLRASAGWKNSGSPDTDYGVILVPWSGTWGVGMWVASDQDLQNRTVLNSGYPGDKSPYGFNWEDTGNLTGVSTSMLSYMLDTFGGESGSPVFALKSGTDWSSGPNVWAVGVHGYGGCPNKAVRMTQSVTNDYLHWAKEPLA